LKPPPKAMPLARQFDFLSLSVFIFYLKIS